MTLYMLFAGLGMLIYTGVAYAEAAVSRFNRVHVAFGLQFAFFVSLSMFLATVILFHANRLMRKHSSSVARVSGWRTRIVVAIVFFADGVAMLIAATREPGEASIVSPNGSRAAMVGNETAPALAVGRTLFQERGCVGCHRSDATGVGPSLHGLFGSPVQDPGCGVAIVDESYLREAILNALATVAAGFPPVMPTFAGQLTEEELQSLIVYVKSLSVPVQVQGTGLRRQVARWTEPPSLSDRALYFRMERHYDLVHTIDVGATRGLVGAGGTFCATRLMLGILLRCGALHFFGCESSRSGKHGVTTEFRKLGYRHFVVNPVERAVPTLSDTSHQNDRSPRHRHFKRNFRTADAWKRGDIDFLGDVPSSQIRSEPMRSQALEHSASLAYPRGMSGVAGDISMFRLALPEDKDQRDKDDRRHGPR